MSPLPRNFLEFRTSNRYIWCMVEINLPSIPHRGRCSCSGMRAHTHPYRLLQRASRSCPRGRQAGTATTLPIIRVGNHASAVTLVGCGGPGDLQDRPPRLQMPPWSSSRLPIRSVHSGFNFRLSRQHAFIYEVGPTTVRPTNQIHDTGSTRVSLRLVCRVELVIPDSRSTPLEQN